ncbi:MAG: dethiobiotin synthase [Verrucomicrobia bacterium]|nr:dethiobiotin synthase [Verrucomicrobiota bacterium]MBI3871039.1 dethiobiotin synthase [Verrucomicrobiota bacterium]
MSNRIIFVTGTDTGVGKTVFTVCLIHYLKSLGARVAALKPFSSGGRADAETLWREADSGLSLNQVNPFWTRVAVAPGAVRMRSEGPARLHRARDHIRDIASRYDVTVVEGIGGLCVPLSKRFLLADLIQQLNSDVVVVGRNALGTLNHTLLTVSELRRRNQSRVAVVLMDFFPRDASAMTNQKMLLHIIDGVVVERFPFLPSLTGCIVKSSRVERILKKTLAAFSPLDTFSTRRCETPETKTSVARLTVRPS